MPDASPIILWFRRDLRLDDNPALAAALRTGAAILPVYVLDETPGGRRPGAASLWWLERSLAALGAALAARGSRLILRRGPADLVIEALAEETAAAGVVWNAVHEPGLAERDADLAQALRARGAEPRRFQGGSLVQPDQVRTRAGAAFSVFTPFWRAARDLVSPGTPFAAPAVLATPEAWPPSDRLADWALYAGKPDWASGFAGWRPGEAGARKRLDAFVAGPLARYAEDRNLPGVEGGSRLSPHLHFGEISPKTCWRAARAAADQGRAPEAEVDKFLAELGWREFNLAVAGRVARLDQENFDPRFDAFPWRTDPVGLAAWKAGRTGYPIVDAGMRELWATGWMHNRVRMIVASFLTKHLLIDWREGEAWFWDTLVDADFASNAGNWQWVAGSGADAQPFFRIFNPMLQSARFDPEGRYLRRWLPELAGLPDGQLHAPWTAGADALARAGIRLGETYPRPIVDHDLGRKRALEAYARLRGRVKT